jgi:hypothetical protein
MIQFPRRSVTRFFIPLVDVMILLFSMFMLMPNLEKARKNDVGGGDKESDALLTERDKLERDLKRLADQVREMTAVKNAPEDLPKLLEELQRLRKEQARGLAQRYAIRVLEIDPRNGELVYYDGQSRERKVIDSDKAATAMIRKDERAEARAEQARELYYLFLFPRVNSGFPLGGQIRNYKTWFAGVPYGFDEPGGATK